MTIELLILSFFVKIGLVCTLWTIIAFCKILFICHAKTINLYYTGLNPDTMEEIFVPRSKEDKKMQRALLQYRKKENYDIVHKALELAGQGTTWMRRNQIWHKILFFAKFLIDFVKLSLKLFINSKRWFVHKFKHIVFSMLRSNFKLTTYVMLD